MDSMLDDLVRALAERAGGSHAIDVVETHASRVILTSSEVYKIKRPVDLGFLDFTALEARRRACEAEVALNRRLAPNVYLGVVPIRRDAAGRHHLDGTGETVDWAVNMVRLPDGERADVLLAQGLLTGAAIDRLAKRLAEFHRDAHCDAETSRFGEPDVVLRNVVENFDQTRAWRDRYLSVAQFDEIERWQRSFLHDRAGILANRIAARRVRDGHGDLRLEHVYFRPGGDVTVIDCIEFNDRFRYADVCADLAFLSMDLGWHGRVDLAERLLARYARESDDYDLYSVVDFYESYRAFVRGKIAGMLAKDEQASREARDRGAHEARRYFLLALAAERRPLVAPVVVAVGGVIASGKSTIADAIGLELGAPVVDADRTRKHLLGVNALQPVRDPAWQGAYDPAFSERVYAEVLRRAAVVVDSGRPVVVEASFRSVAQRAAVRRMAESRGLPFRFVECRAPADVCRERLRRRERETGVSDGRLDIFDAFCARYEPVRELPSDVLVTVDTTRPIERTLHTLRHVLPVWPRGLVA